MSGDEDFWADLLGHMREQVLIPVVGPDVSTVGAGGAEQTLSALIGQRLMDRYGLTMTPPVTDMGQAVEAFLRDRGRDEAERLYRVINDILLELDPVPGAALRDLAAIDDMRLFVSTTPDRMLAQALNEVRFHGDSLTREIAFSPIQSTSEQARNAAAGPPGETVVLSLFGQAASTPQYAIHEEDQLEWLHALISDSASLPQWLGVPLRHQPILFVGCDIPDWLGRFLLRMESTTRLSLERKQFFLVYSAKVSEPSLSAFFATYCSRTQVQQLQMEPAAFVAELRARWEKQNLTRPRAAASRPQAAESGPPTIFISYMREDVAAARALGEAIQGLGGDVWLDEQRLSPGDAWEQDILAAIRRTVRLFVPVISANTEREDEGYVFREWAEAVERSRSIPRRRFIVPVIVDPDCPGDPSGYRQVPEEFRQVNFGRAPGGVPDAALLAMLTEEIRNMRRPGGES